jgi:hypothetical protein
MDDARTGKGIIYQAPTIFVGLFYTLLTIWTVVSVPLIVLKSSDLSSLLLLMITFVIAYTWYFSLGIFYRIRMEENGSIQLKSLRRGLRSHCRKIDRVEGPPVPITFGFIKFRLEGEKVYVFFMKHRSFQQFLSIIRRSNPNITFKNLSPTMHQIT